MHGGGLSPKGSPFGWFRGGGQLSSRPPVTRPGKFPIHGESDLMRSMRGTSSHWDRSLKEPLVISPSMVKVPQNLPPEIRSPSVSSSSGVGGIKVLSVAPAISSPVATLSLIIPTGSRNETHHTRGASHFLRHMAFKGNKLRSSIEQVRELDQLGATMEVVTDREFTSFTSSFISEDLPFVYSALSGVLLPKLPEWEVNDTLPEVEREAEAAANNPAIQLVDALHREAFRGSGLANSLHAPLWNLHHLDNETLSHFVKDHYRYDKAVVVAVGLNDYSIIREDQLNPMNFNELSNYLLNFTVLEQGKLPAAKPVAPASYVGGEARIEGAGLNHVALAFEGASRSSRDIAAFEVLQSLVGSAAADVGRPSGLATRIGAILRKRAGGAIIEGGALQYRYSDTGLFGAYLVGNAPVSTLVGDLQALFAELKNVGDEELSTAKKRAKLRIASKTEGRHGYASWIAQQALSGNAEADPRRPLDEIDQVTLADASSLASRIVSGKPTLAAYGDVSKV